MNKMLKQIIWLIIATPLVYLAYVWNSLPEQVPYHFDLEGNPDQFGSKKGLLIMMIVLSAINAATYLLLSNVHRIDPKKYAVENKPRLQRMGFAISIFISVLLCVIIYSSMHADKKLSTRLIFSAVGLLFCFIGNYMHTLKPNYFAGLRLPWTLENEDNWRKTHLLAGKLFFVGGLLIAIVCLVTPIIAAIVAFFTITAIILIIPCIYSYRLYRKQNSLTHKK